MTMIFKHEAYVPSLTCKIKHGYVFTHTHFYISFYWCFPLFWVLYVYMCVCMYFLQIGILVFTSPFLRTKPSLYNKSTRMKLEWLSYKCIFVFKSFLSQCNFLIVCAQERKDKLNREFLFCSDGDYKLCDCTQLLLYMFWWNLHTSLCFDLVLVRDF